MALTDTSAHKKNYLIIHQNGTWCLKDPNIAHLITTNFIVTDTHIGVIGIDFIRFRPDFKGTARSHPYDIQFLASFHPFLTIGARLPLSAITAAELIVIQLVPTVMVLVCHSINVVVTV